ncbi:hypothetical protein ACFWXO_10220 [Kitasatospora sp. NPDC059088]|uniref:hypothetical protein n=1 Tax=Kitasatospora sp. NPDC059088 TaxID=3346722 RepID=UPI0036B6FFD5
MDASQSDGEITRNAPRVSPVRRGARLPQSLRSARERAGRERAGWLLLAVGAVLCVLGWYGVSGERFVEQQVPYLASATVPGAALIVAGAVLVALRPPPPRGHLGELTDRRVERLYDLLVEPGAEPGPGPDPAPAHRSGPLAVPEGTRYHRPDCPLVTGKATAAPVDAAAVQERGLTPCPLCSPDAPGAPDALGLPETPNPPNTPDAPSRPATRPGEAAPPSG